MSAPPVSSRVSLQRKLLLWLLLPQLILWITSGFLAWRIALQNGEKGIDQMLTQSVRALARQIKPIGDGLLVDFPKAAQDILVRDPTDPITYMVSSPPGRFLLGNAQLPPPPEQAITLGEPLLYRASVNGRPARLALLEMDYGSEPNRQRLRVQVAQSLAVRQRIAQELLHQMVLPIGMIGLAFSILVYIGILRGLQPLKRLEAQIDQASRQRRLDLAPQMHIELTEAPLEVHSLASTINRLLDTIAQGHNKEKRFLNDAAHQLRTPLAGLIGQVELALSESQEPAVRERLNKVLSGAQRSAHLVRQLLQLARSESQAPLQALNLPALAREVARDWTRRAFDADIDLGYEGADALWVKGNDLLLREALNNLIDNALHYSGPGTRVTVRVERDPTQSPWLHLWVEDDGPGVKPEDLPELFSRFWRGTDIPGGCGLGLSIVQGIALQHDGQAQAESVAPHGLRVGLHLPIVQDATAT